MNQDNDRPITLSLITPILYQLRNSYVYKTNDEKHQFFLENLII